MITANDDDDDDDDDDDVNTLFRCDITPRCRTIIGACSGRMLHPNGCDF